MDRAHGDVSVFVKNNLPKSLVDVNLPSQTKVLKVTICTTITFCNLNIQSFNGGN